MSLVIGLTGGIASGKSTVSKMLAERGLVIIDADSEAREAVEVDKPAYKKIVATFGEDILQEDKTLNRQKLGKIIFNDIEEREKLNKILHPEIRQGILKKRDQALKKGEKIIVLDIPLLVENKLQAMVDFVLLVYLEEASQLKRLQKRDKLSEEAALARINAQLPIKEKLQYADFIIDNNGGIAETERQLEAILQTLTEGVDEKKGKLF